MDRKIATKRSTETERHGSERHSARRAKTQKYHTCPRAEREPERHLGLELPNLRQNLNASTGSWVF